MGPSGEERRLITGGQRGISRSDASSAIEPLFAGGGEMGALMSTIDWSATPIGPVSTWSESLRTALRICLRSRFPMLILWGRELVMLYNDAYRPITGDKHPTSMGQAGAECWAEIWDVIGPMMQSVLDGGEATWSEDQLLIIDRNDGLEECYFTFSYSPLPDDDAPVGGVLTTVTETTSDVIRGRRLRTLRDLADRTPTDGSLRDVLKAVAAGLERNIEDVPFALLYLVDDDREHAELVAGAGVPLEGPRRVPLTPGGPTPPDDRWSIAAVARSGTSAIEAVPAELAATLATPSRAAAVVPVDDPTGSGCAAVLILGTSTLRTFDADYRSFFGLVGDHVSRALADARARERERRRLEALAELNRAKSEFFSNVSHEFRTPLTLMLGPIEEALDGGRPLTSPALDQVNRNALRLLKLVNTLLDFSRLEAGRLEPHRRVVDLAALTEELAGVFRSAIEAAGLEYVVDCDPSVGRVAVDPDTWEKVVLNLLSNALKFTERGRIEVRLRPDGDGVALLVRDTGAGIAEDELPHVFDRFYRVSQVEARSHEGSGIGLALVRDLLQRHGGDVTAESRLGVGSTFTARVPVVPVAESEDAEPSPSVGPSAAATTYVAEALGWIGHDPTDDEDLVGQEDGQGGDGDGDAPRPLVLVVDDNADMRDYLRDILSRRWRVVTARDGQEALELLSRRRPDLVLTDVMMPQVDGFELLSTIRERSAVADLPVVLLSARAGPEASADGLTAGADDYVVKPFTAAELEARIQANLERARLRREVAAARTRAELLSGVSHEMQTPLAVVLGALPQLADDHLDPEVRSKLASSASRRARHLANLVQQFLDFARLESEQTLRISPRRVELRGVVEDALAVTGRTSATTIEATEDVSVLADADRVVQILTNLIDNAFQHGAHHAQIRTAVVDDRTCEISVSDDGPGVPAAIRDRVFDRFFRVGGHGSGLGLYVARALAEAQDGTLDVVSDGGSGATFRLRLPRG